MLLVSVTCWWLKLAKWQRDSVIRIIINKMGEYSGRAKRGERTCVWLWKGCPYNFSTLIFFPLLELPLFGDLLPSFPTVILVPSLLCGLSRHISLFKHSSHLGLIGAQMVWPNPTNRRFKSLHSSLMTGAMKGKRGGGTCTCSFALLWSLSLSLSLHSLSLSLSLSLFSPSLFSLFLSPHTC